MSVRKARQSRVVDHEIEQPVTPARKPRHSIIYSHSPLSTPSLSASLPFDWEAAKGHRPPPYQTPNAIRSRRSRPSMGVGVDSVSASGVNLANGRQPRKSRVIIRTSWSQWLSGLPAHWWLKLSMMHHDLPLPPPKTTGRMIGTLLHAVHALSKWREIAESQRKDDGWGELNAESIFPDEDEDSPLWTQVPFLVTLVLFTISFVRTFIMFKASKAYDFQLRDDHSRLYKSPNITLVSAPTFDATGSDDSAPITFSRILRYLASALGRALLQIWRFLVYRPKSESKLSHPKSRASKRLELWDPSAQDLALFEVYSPLHAALWYLVQSKNWQIVFFVMVVTTFQLGALTRAYGQLVKDREIVASEVMYEYNTRFVNPRLNPTKKDACVMTHESEMVSYQDHSPRYRHTGA